MGEIRLHPKFPSKWKRLGWLGRNPTLPKIAFKIGKDQWADRKDREALLDEEDDGLSTGSTVGTVNNGSQWGSDIIIHNIQVKVLLL